ncbi:MAG: hypothetical protein JWN92_1025, partial [Candidatus Acidoferrum typicum]|nr:hypothetical protein [Candidatus Acidoferrum typicum]
MRKRVAVSIFGLAAVLSFSPILRAQTTQAAAKAKKEPDARAVSKLKAAADHAPDFSGVWEGHMPASARRWAGYSFVGGIPEMTPWGKALYETTKPSWGPQAVVDSTDIVNPTT